MRWKDSVAGYAANGLKNTYNLRQALLNGTYHTLPYQEFIIKEPKERTILATRMRDRQFQRSLCDNILYPGITRKFIHDNCACQHGKGTDFALKRIKTHLRRYYAKYGADGWVLKCDIKKFFPSTPHQTVIDKLRALPFDGEAIRRTCGVVASFAGVPGLEAEVEAGGDDPYRGIGLGSQTSQLIQLLLLNDLDHYIKERLRIKYYVRYMDDFVLIHPDKEYLKKCREKIAERVNALGLELNQHTTLYPLRQGVKFLGWRFILKPDTGKVIMRMNPACIRREKKKLETMRERSIPLEHVRESYRGWLANAERGQTNAAIQVMRRYYQNLFSEGAPQNGGKHLSKQRGKAGGRGEHSIPL